MRYEYIIPTLCMFGTVSLHAEEKGLGNILQQVGTQKKVIVEPEQKKKNTKKQTRFIFKDEFHTNGLGLKAESASEDKAKSYEYENKSRFKFKFNDGSGNNNFVAGQRSPDIGGSIGGGSAGGSSGAGSTGGGGGRR